jgi:hypothetical protein
LSIRLPLIRQKRRDWVRLRRWETLSGYVAPTNADHILAGRSFKVEREALHGVLVETSLQKHVGSLKGSKPDDAAVLQKIQYLCFAMEGDGVLSADHRRDLSCLLDAIEDGSIAERAVTEDAKATAIVKLKEFIWPADHISPDVRSLRLAWAGFGHLSVDGTIKPDLFGLSSGLSGSWFSFARVSLTPAQTRAPRSKLRSFGGWFAGHVRSCTRQ